MVVDLLFLSQVLRDQMGLISKPSIFDGLIDLAVISVVKDARH